jgi:hypothetical protein
MERDNSSTLSVMSKVSFYFSTSSSMGFYIGPT